jgi:hypothetical protein
MPFPLVSTQIDKRQVFDLPSPTMGRSKIGVMNTHQASATENELLIFQAVLKLMVLASRSLRS